MNVNNQMYKMFEEMIKGYKENESGLFEHGARCWMELDPENPFQEDDPAYEEFFQMRKGYSLWKMGGADRKINRRRMLSAAERLCETNPAQPYKFDKKAEERELAEKIAAEKARMEQEMLEQQLKEEIPEPEKPKDMVFGVVPDESTIKPKKAKQFFDKLFKRQG